MTKATAPAAAPSGPVTSTLRWWSVPMKARRAARNYATSQNKSVTRVVRIQEPDGSARFDVYAAGRSGLTRLPESVLVSVNDDSAKKEQ